VLHNHQSYLVAHPKTLVGMQFDFFSWLVKQQAVWTTDYLLHIHCMLHVTHVLIIHSKMHITHYTILSWLSRPLFILKLCLESRNFLK